ncbi:hypothetical protein [Methanohalobium sp.]|uniref:hypothetical protein n=1 Tax=Methanohalobium sp. TaxID=2837493 RepID=UPI0025F50812|nr:hypothetical protein [Methanohalobium sp.]
MGEDNKGIYILLLALIGVLAVLAPFMYDAYMKTTDDYYVSAHLSDITPNDYTGISDEDLDKYPKLKEALDKKDIVELTKSKYSKLDEFLAEGDDGITYIKYKDDYYGIWLQHIVR